MAKLQDKYRCYNCGKSFKDNQGLIRHKNRKTPCIIQDIKPEDINNPNKCQFCNKVLKTKRNLIRHFDTCKIKNGGADILYAKVKHENELAEQKKQLIEQGQQLANQDQKLKELEEIIKNGGTGHNTISHHNQKIGQINNTQNTLNADGSITYNNNTFILNSFNKPNIPPQLTAEELNKELDRFLTLGEYLFKNLWFNSKYPENYSILPCSSKKVLYYNGEIWRERKNGHNEAADIMLLRGNPNYTQEEITKLDSSCIKKLRNYNSGEEPTIEQSEMYNCVAGDVGGVISADDIKCASIWKQILEIAKLSGVDGRRLQ
ncbi:MAG: hypothetical protein KAS12_06420 [Candidatus Aenigmarchaeota archaeon]|nr:hypothetical protein [Candidatus Aenigmarchaeota archaeon]